MKKKNIITLITTLAVLLIVYVSYMFFHIHQEDDVKKIGFLYVGDSCNTYTNNFIHAEKMIENTYGDKVQVAVRYNVREGEEGKYLQELVNENCDLIFATSYGYGETTKKFAEKYPDVEFCMATCSNANEDPVLPNFHNFMGEIYQGRYVSGVVAGMKIQEMIEDGRLKKTDAKVGYVGAFPYAEVISGYTAFYMGVASIVPEATMEVEYTNSWGDYYLEKDVATDLIADGCVIISQHSDTSGPAVACENARKEYEVYHVGYNQSMYDVAPTTSLISSRINWQHYMLAATEAVIEGKRIEDCVSGHRHGNDMSGGFKEGWVQMLKLNDTIAAEGTQKKIDELIHDFEAGNVEVYHGDYIGVDPQDPSDTIDLNQGYVENKDTSAPMFHYVLQDVITIREKTE